jgi:hypothetical protein
MDRTRRSAGPGNADDAGGEHRVVQRVRENVAEQVKTMQPSRTWPGCAPPQLGRAVSLELTGWLCFLVSCHPLRWWDRYGEEMHDVLNQHQATERTVLSRWASAVSATGSGVPRGGAVAGPRAATAMISAP